MTALSASYPPSSATAPSIATIVSYMRRCEIAPRELGFRLIYFSMELDLHIRHRLSFDTWLCKVLSAMAAIFCVSSWASFAANRHLTSWEVGRKPIFNNDVPYSCISLESEPLISV